MKIVRVTFRLPSELWSKCRILAEENDISLNKQFIELIRFGIQSFLEKRTEYQENVRGKNHERKSN